MDFTAIDFETANGHRTSACSIGIAVVKNNTVMETGHWLIKPHPFYFDGFNTMIHGIRERDVADAPDFGELWPELWAYMDGRAIVAHNASFDISILRHTLEYYNLERPNIDILCSYRLAKAAYPNMGSHRLNVVCAAKGIPLEHHRADSDAAASAEIVCRISEEFSLSEPGDIRRVFSLHPGYLNADNSYKPFRGSRAAVAKALKSDYDAVCPSPEFEGKSFVFTGTLTGMARSKAFEVVAKGGGIPQQSITQSTDYLVLGIQDYSKFKDGKLSSKTKRAMDMQEHGHPISIIGEDDFISLIDDGLYKLCFETEHGL